MIVTCRPRREPQNLIILQVPKNGCQAKDQACMTHERFCRKCRSAATTSIHRGVATRFGSFAITNCHYGYCVVDNKGALILISHGNSSGDRQTDIEEPNATQLPVHIRIRDGRTSGQDRRSDLRRNPRRPHCTRQVFPGRLRDDFNDRNRLRGRRNLHQGLRRNSGYHSRRH